MTWSVRRLLIVPAILMGVMLTSGCSLGRTKISETYYYAVPSPYKDGNTNYYRLKICGSTLLGKTQYRSGYYPARAVDAFLGNVQLDKGARELEVEERLMNIIDEGTVTTWRNYVKSVVNGAEKDGAGDAKYVEAKSLARQTLLEHPRKSRTEIDYNPAGNIITTNANDKLIFFLSSNPDEVVSRIASFAEDEKTIQSVNRITQFIAEPKVKDLQVATTQNQLLESQVMIIASKMKSWSSVGIDNGTKGNQAIAELFTLLNAVASEVKP